MGSNEFIKNVNDLACTLQIEAVAFIEKDCKGLRHDKSKDSEDGKKIPFTGKSLKKNQIPFNMEKDIDRLCFQKAVERFLRTGKKEDAFDVYFCYLEMFVSEYKKTRRMIELLSEFENAGSRLLMKHRDHYVHSVYVFCLGLAIYRTNSAYRSAYKNFYNIEDEIEVAHHYLKYWGLAALFHDIGYPFELPFEQVCSYFEVDGVDREKRPYMAYRGLDDYLGIKKATQRKIAHIYNLGTDKIIASTDQLFAYSIYQALGEYYYFSEEEICSLLSMKPVKPNKFNHHMDHAYFSAAILFKKLFEEINMELTKECVDSLSAIILHNSLYKFSIAFYKDKVSNIRLKAERHPLAFMLMLCDELQCWDRTAYGRNSRHELYPMNCRFDFSNNSIKANYIFDAGAQERIDLFKKGKLKSLKAFASFYSKNTIQRDDNSIDTVCKFQSDIEQIVDLSQMNLEVDYSVSKAFDERKMNISDSNYINLYNFAIVLNGRWGALDEWRRVKNEGLLEEYLNNQDTVENFEKIFEDLSLEYKLSNINQAKAFAKYLNVLGCFYTDKDVDFDMIDKFSEEDLLVIGPMEHQRWLQEHYDMGWTYGSPDKNERELLRQHKDLIVDRKTGGTVSLEEATANYNRLDKAEQDKDTEPMECMLDLMKMYDGMRIYRF